MDNIASQRHKIVVIVSILIFLACFRFGLILAQHKPIWNDEAYSQSASVARISYFNMLLGRIGEGNNSPLFYALQKMTTQLFGYETPSDWTSHQTTDRDKIILRIVPVLFTSLAIMLIFYYFARFHHIGVGLLALFITFSTSPIWDFWAEARPYALWIFLTTLQSVLFLWLVRKKRAETRIGTLLIATHILLSLTCIFSLVQVAIASVLVWIFIRPAKKYFIGLTLIPILINLFYYIQAPKYAFWFLFTPEQLIRACFSRERFYILFVFVLFLGLHGLQKFKKYPGLLKTSDSLIREIPYLALTVLMILSAAFIIFIFKMQESPPNVGFIVSNRYFLYLTPLGIIGATLLSTSLIQSLQNKYVKIICILPIAYLLMTRFFKTLADVKDLYPFLF